MDIQSLKLELVQHLVSTNDATALTKVKRLFAACQSAGQNGRRGRGSDRRRRDLRTECLW